jgi:dipeptidyl aminopeptidase/acylaminoacyl peptidase
MRYIKYMQVSFIVLILCALMPLSSKADEQDMNFQGSIIYTKVAPNLKRQIMLINNNANQIYQLTNSDEHNGAPYWSPDGKKILFERAKEIYIMDVSERTVSRITNTPIGVSTSPRWGYDGSGIFYTWTIEGNMQEIYYDLETGIAMLINEVGNFIVSSESQITYEEFRQLSHEEKQKFKNRVQRDLKELENYFKSVMKFYRTYPSFDGNYDMHKYTGQSKIVLVNKKTGEKKTLHGGLPAWSKDSEKIAYITSKKGVYKEFLNVYSIRDDTITEYEIDVYPHSCGGPSWSPDSTKIVYSCGKDDMTRYEDMMHNWLYIYDLEANKTFKLTKGGAPDWHDAEISTAGLDPLSYDEVNISWEMAVIVKDRVYEGNSLEYKENYIEAFKEDSRNAHKAYLRLLRNEIFARHGRTFKSEDLNEIFKATDWYKPDPNYSDDMLNDIERKNVQFILDYEKKMGWR